MEELLRDVLSRLAMYKGRIICGSIGIVTGLLWAFLGFGRAIAFIFCVLVGYFLGRKVDRRDSFRDILNRVLPPKD